MDTIVYMYHSASVCEELETGADNTFDDGHMHNVSRPDIVDGDKGSCGKATPIAQRRPYWYNSHPEQLSR